MAIISVSPAGQLGIVEDTNPAELQPQAWSRGKNVQFSVGAVSPIMDPIPLVTGLAFQPTWAVPAMQTSAGLSSWVVSSQSKLYSFITGVLTDITRVAGGDYMGALASRWSGDVLSGVSVANNGVDIPQAWMSSDSSVKMIDLPNWPSTVRVAALRSFKQYLVGLDVTKGGIRYPTLVKWSHPADPGAVPISWDEADPTRDAGEYPLSETSGYCVDAVPMKDSMVIYKSDSVYAMQYIGGTYIFKFYKLFDDFGMPNRDCAVEYQPGKHFVFTGTDLKIHDGQTANSVVSGKMQKRLKSLSVPQLKGAYVCLNTLAHEVWFCYRVKGDVAYSADTAITYNWDDGTLSVRDIPEYRFMVNGRLDPPVTGVVTWDSTTQTWDEATMEWGEAQTIPSTIRMLGLGDHQIDWVDSTVSCSYTSFLERTYLGVAMQAGKAPDLSSTKFLSRLWPRFTGTTGDVVYITVGGADSVSKAIAWEAPQQFIIGVDEFVDCTLSNKMFAFRIESSSTSVWTFNGLDGDVILVGAG